MQGGFSITYANVMAKVSSATSNCSKLDASKARIVPGKPDASLIYIKTSFASPPGGCGGHMPYRELAASSRISRPAPELDPPGREALTASHRIA